MEKYTTVPKDFGEAIQELKSYPKRQRSVKNKHHQRNREWVKRMPEVMKALNAETKKHPLVVIRKAGAPVCPTVNVRYLYQPGE